MPVAGTKVSEQACLVPAIADTAASHVESQTWERRPRVLFVGVSYLGHRTRFMNLQAHVEPDDRIRAEFDLVTRWSRSGQVRLGPLPERLSGRLRAFAGARSLARIPRPDVVWTNAANELALYAWAGWGPWRRPLVLDLDGTPAQLEEMAPVYRGNAPRQGLAWSTRHAWQRLAWSSVTHFAPISHWAAAGLEREGVPADRISVMPAGVDLEAWQPAPPRQNAVPRLLFVGGDFERKGGGILVEALRHALAGRVTLDIVTYGSPSVPPGVRVHRAEPNSQELRALYREADLFVLPTRGDCYPVVAIEAMAAGLPVVVGDVGATREIVDQGETGWVVKPDAGELVRVLDQAIGDRSRLEAMGRRARSVAELRFDGARNDRRIVDLLLRLHESRPPVRRLGR